MSRGGLCGTGGGGAAVGCSGRVCHRLHFLPTECCPARPHHCPVRATCRQALPGHCFLALRPSVGSTSRKGSLYTSMTAGSTRQSLMPEPHGFGSKNPAQEQWSGSISQSSRHSALLGPGGARGPVPRANQPAVCVGGHKLPTVQTPPGPSWLQQRCGRGFHWP